ncbi:MAG: gamma-glutamyl-gamma-aminobutyrate hydrolase family protein [Fimbriimonadaceae bacterium]|nr:gamma-glutamyl-gamma-aminobutyrate hydrolase family protein [Fimbriimonadaceae bacterium]
MKPIVGISTRLVTADDGARRIDLPLRYAEAIAMAGGVPVILPPLPEVADYAGLVHAWLIPGGGDLDSALWNEPPHPKAEGHDPQRFASDQALYRALSDRPILGVCHGCQFLNVMRGGSLIQHVPDVVGHEAHTGGTLQRYRIAPDSRLGGILGERAEGKSYHHQAVGRVGGGLRAVAWAEDGIVEAVEGTDGPWLIGIQWHPETTNEHADSQSVFRAFVGAADAYRRTR